MVWGITGLWFFVMEFLLTNSVDQKFHGFSEVMGYHKHGLRQDRLYYFHTPSHHLPLDLM